MMFRRGETRTAVETVIGPAVVLRGDVEFAGGLHVEGRVFGHVRVPSGQQGSVAMTESGVIEGDLRASEGNLNGRVRGDVHVDGALALGPRAVIEGNVVYGSLEMAAGARISGQMQRRAPAA